MSNLPTGLPESEGNSKDKIVEVAEETLAQIPPPELEPYNISFVNYKKDKCKVDGMEGKNAQAAIKIVRDIGLYFKNKEYFSTIANSKMEIKQVFNSSPYDDYYKGLPDEIKDSQEVKEIKFVDEKKNVDLRIYYYTLPSIFYMLAITANAHQNLDHREYRFKNNKHKRNRW